MWNFKKTNERISSNSGLRRTDGRTHAQTRIIYRTLPTKAGGPKSSSSKTINRERSNSGNTWLNGLFKPISSQCFIAIPPENKRKTIRFSDIFRGYRNGTRASTALSKYLRGIFMHMSLWCKQSTCQQGWCMLGAYLKMDHYTHAHRFHSVQDWKFLVKTQTLLYAF